MSLVVNRNKKRRIDPLESISFRTIACRMTIYLRICIRCGIGLHTIYIPTDYCPAIRRCLHILMVVTTLRYLVKNMFKWRTQVADCMGTMPWPWRRSMNRHDDHGPCAPALYAYIRLWVKIADPKIADYLKGRSQKRPMTHWAPLK